MPSWTFNLNVSQSRILLDAFMLGKTTESIKFGNKNMVDNFQQLCLHAGFSAYYTSDGDSFTATVNTTFNEPYVNKNSLEDHYIDYNGKVYCCTVPSGIVYVRKNGVPVWCGNSRHGQKGTIGLTLPHSDMPFTEEGITPDIIMNPNALPSRMTMGQFLECLFGKISALRGHETDGTPFKHIDPEKMKDILEGLGYERNGNEYLYNGMSGQKMRSQIFIGPLYYQRLKHMVNDKMHSRSRGPRTLITRQPPEGRARDGGLRFGEMERDTIVAYGMSAFLKERMMECSDAYTTHVCDKCGLFAQRKLRKDNKPYPTKNDIYFCPIPDCRNANISKIAIPYAFKLLCHEMMGMGIAPRIRIANSKYTTNTHL
jgi:DNA-directed RNA polymerase II subunit RPB2